MELCKYVVHPISQVHYVGILTFFGILWRVSKLYIFGNLIV